MISFLKRYLPAGLWRQLRGGRHFGARLIRRCFAQLGYTVTRKGDYYSPLPSESALARTGSRWIKPSALRGVQYDVEEMKRRLERLRETYYDEFLALPSYQSLRAEGFGPGFPQVDAFTLYATIRELRPRQYLEVGSGLSTYYCSLAVARNRAESHETRMTCIEPYPYPRLRQLEGIELLVDEVQDVPLERFQSLGEGDILFIDSSHAIRLDGDVPYLFLEVLPALAPGVYIHIHDIPFPYNIPYPAEYWTLGQHPDSPHWPMYWNEAMLVQAFLAFNPSFEIVLSTPLLRHQDEAFLRKTLPIAQSIAEEPNTYSSLWLRRRPGS